MTRIPIFMASDDKYVGMAATAMASVCSNTDSEIAFCFLDCGLSVRNKKMLQMTAEKLPNSTLEIIPVDLSRFAHVRLRNYVTIAGFARLLIPELKPELEKIIYLDCDTITLKDIRELYVKDLSGKALGAVPDWHAIEDGESKHMRYSGAKLSDTHAYFNSGVMLINPKQWAADEMFDKCIEAESETANTRMFNDQDVLNKAFDSNFTHLDKRFNVKSNLVDDFDSNDIVVRHFTSFIKPNLHLGFTQKNADDFWFYANMTPFYAEMFMQAFIEPMV